MEILGQTINLFQTKIESFGDVNLDDIIYPLIIQKLTKLTNITNFDDIIQLVKQFNKKHIFLTTNDLYEKLDIDEENNAYQKCFCCNYYVNGTNKLYIKITSYIDAIFFVTCSIKDIDFSQYVTDETIVQNIIFQKDIYLTKKWNIDTKLLCGFNFENVNGSKTDNKLKPILDQIFSERSNQYLELIQDICPFITSGSCSYEHKYLDKIYVTLYSQDIDVQIGIEKNIISANILPKAYFLDADNNVNNIENIQIKMAVHKSKHLKELINKCYHGHYVENYKYILEHVDFLRYEYFDEHNKIYGMIINKENNCLFNGEVFVRSDINLISKNENENNISYKIYTNELDGYILSKNITDDNELMAQVILNGIEFGKFYKTRYEGSNIIVDEIFIDGNNLIQKIEHSYDNQQVNNLIDSIHLGFWDVIHTAEPLGTNYSSIFSKYKNMPSYHHVSRWLTVSAQHAQEQEQLKIIIPKIYTPKIISNHKYQLIINPFKNLFSKDEQIKVSVIDKDKENDAANLLEPVNITNHWFTNGIETKSESANGLGLNIFGKNKKLDKGKIGFKAGMTSTGEMCMITLNIPPIAKIVKDDNYEKYKTNIAEVISIDKIFYDKNQIYYYKDIKQHDEKMCGICLADKATLAILLPCKHRICMTCADIVTNSNGSCPFCRSKINQSFELAIPLTNTEISLQEAYSCVHVPDYKYEVGQVYTIDNYTTSITKACGPGIYYHDKQTDILKWFEHAEIYQQYKQFAEVNGQILNVNVPWITQHEALNT